MHSIITIIYNCTSHAAITMNTTKFIACHLKSHFTQTVCGVVPLHSTRDDAKPLIQCSFFRDASKRWDNAAVTAL